MAIDRRGTKRSLSTATIGRATFALVLAFGFWAWVTVQTDPDRRRNFDHIPVTPINVPGDLTVTDISPATGSLSVWGPRSVVSNPGLQAGNFAAIIDLRGTKSGMQRVQVQIKTTTQHLRKQRADPEFVQVTLEHTVDKTLPITSSAQAPQGITITSVMADPPQVKVSGPESLVTRAVRALATVEISDQVTSPHIVTPNVVVEVLDAANNQVTGLTFSPTRVTVATDITDLRNLRTVPVSVPSYHGTLAAGFSLSGTDIIPNLVVLLGNPQALTGITNVPTEPVDIDGLKETASQTVALDTSKLPPGVTIQGDIKTVRVQVNIAEAKLNREFKVPLRLVNVVPGLQPSASDTDVIVTLNGTPAQLDMFSTHPTAQVDVGGIKASGVLQDLPVQVPGLPIGVTFVKSDPATVRVTVSAVPTPTPRPPTATPTTVPTANVTIAPAITSTHTPP